MMNVKCYYCSHYIKLDPKLDKVCNIGVEKRCRGNRYMTRGVEDKISTELQMLMWKAIDEMKVEKVDYLQIFRLRAKIDKQIIWHEQEQPQYQKRYSLNSKEPIKESVYVIIDRFRSTMMLASEY